MEAVYYNFPPMDIIDNHDVRDYEYFRSELLETLPSFLKLYRLADIVITPHKFRR